jgi:hypothetical protein
VGVADVDEVKRLLVLLAEGLIWGWVHDSLGTRRFTESL